MTFPRLRPEMTYVFIYLSLFLFYNLFVQRFNNTKIFTNIFVNYKNNYFCTFSMFYKTTGLQPTSYFSDVSTFGHFIRIKVFE